MKIRTREIKNNVERIFITTDTIKGVNVDLIINGQMITLHLPSVYTDRIFEEIEKYLRIIGDDNYARL